MNIYLIEQNVNFGQDTYRSAVVYAESSESAKMIHPHENAMWVDDGWVYQGKMSIGDKIINSIWVEPSVVSATLIGENKKMKKEEVIHRAFQC